MFGIQCYDSVINFMSCSDSPLHYNTIFAVGENWKPFSNQKTSILWYLAIKNSNYGKTI